MGCGCKKNENTYSDSGEVIEEKLSLFNIIKKGILIILFLLISPLILLLMWIIGINSIVGGNFNVVDVLIKGIKNKNNKIVIEDEEEYNIEDLELLDTEIIK